MQPSIRPVTKDDKPAVMQILRTTPEFTTVDVQVAEELIDTYLDDPTGSEYYIFVAVTDSVVGYVCYGPTPLTEGTWDIFWLAVAKERRGQGLGRMLMGFAEDRIREAKGRLIIIETSSIPSYDRTRAFHQSIGFKIICQIRDFYSIGDDLVIMEKRLT